MSGALVTGASQPGDEPSLEMVTAALRADATDVASLARVLTASLADALPAGVVEVERDRSLGDRLAGREGTVVAVRVTAEGRVLSLSAVRSRPRAEVRQVVRDVVISRREVPVEEWLRLLAAELTAMAERDAAARRALASLLGTS